MQFAAKNLTVGQLNALVKLMGGEVAVHRFLKGELVLREVTSDEVPQIVTLKTELRLIEEVPKAFLRAQPQIIYLGDLLMLPSYFFLTVGVGRKSLEKFELFLTRHNLRFSAPSENRERDDPEFAEFAEWRWEQARSSS